VSLPGSMSSVRSRLSAPFRVCLLHVTCARPRRRSGGVCAGSRGSWPRKCSAVGDPVRLHAGRSHAGTAEMDSVFARVAQPVEQPPCKRQVVRSNRDRGHQGICHVRLAGSGHKIFILVDRGSNPLRDANSIAGSQVIGFRLFSKEAQCSQERSAETGLKDWVAPELVTGNFLEDWPRGSRHSLAK
jgi:hypothetical protein